MLRVWGERYVSYCYYCLEKSTPTGATKHSVSAKNEECVLMREENQACAFVEGKLSPQSFLNSMRSCNNNKDKTKMRERGRGLSLRHLGILKEACFISLHKSGFSKSSRQSNNIKSIQIFTLAVSDILSSVA